MSILEPVDAAEEKQSDTMYAMVRRHPTGGYSVIIGLVEFDHTPDVDADNDPHYTTLAAAVRFAQGAGLWCCHPEIYRPLTRLIKGL